LSQEDEQDANEDPDPDQFFTVLVSIRSFLKFLNSHVVSTTTIACMLRKCHYFPRNSVLGFYFSQFSGVCQHHCMILYVYIGEAEDAGGVLTFYIPAILDDGDH